MNATHGAQVDIAVLRDRVAPIRIPGGVRAMFLILMAIGLVSFLVDVGPDPKRAFAGYLLGYVYVLGIGLAGTFFTALHYLVGATWSVVVRRVAEAFSSYLPVALGLLLVVLLGIPDLYVWSTHPVVEGGHALDLTKGGYLSTPLFTLRLVLILALWSIFGWYFRRNSLRQDETGDVALTRANGKAAPIFVLLFALTATLVAFDLLMSLEPTWYSTIFGVYFFAGLWQAGLAALTIVVVLLRRQGALEGVVNRFHYWDLGKYLFAFSVFWMYIAFSQFMLIWYANLPEETGWMIKRTYTSWGGFGIALMALRFAIPFFALMPQKVKENEIGLLVIAGGILIGHWIDLYWTILPAFAPAGVNMKWTEIGITLGFIGLLGWMVLRFLSRHPVAAHRDPLFEESVRFHG
jgi:hypothetical protein